MTPLIIWISENCPEYNMLWKESAVGEFDWFLSLENEFGRGNVINTHQSKSITLPVVRYVVGTTEFILRDNFNDINLCVISKEPINLPLSAVYDTMTWDDYLAAVVRSRNYTYRNWTDEEMADPTLLCVQDQHPGVYTQDVDQDKKTRWVNRFTDTSWYREDWSSDELICEGDVGPGCTLYLAGRAFVEGISRTVPSAALKSYRVGRKAFTIACNKENALSVMRAIVKEQAG